LLLYHNVTPAKFFRGEHPALKDASARARAELPGVSGAVDCAVAHSAFSAAELHESGYKRVVHIPYLLWEPVYSCTDPSVFARNGGRRNLLTVGRIAPHKRLELALLTMDYLSKYVDRSWRLIVVGGAEDFMVYEAQLRDLARQTCDDNVIFTGHVPQAALVSYYQMADAF